MRGRRLHENTAGVRRRPCCLKARGGLPSLPPLGQAEGMERREALVRFRTLRCAVLRNAENLRPAALHRGVITAPGRAFGG